MPSVTTNFPKYGKRMKLLHTCPVKKMLERNPKCVPTGRLKRGKKEHLLNFKLKLVREILIPV